MTQDAFTALLEQYVDTLQEEGIDDPLSARLTLAAVLADLCTLVGADVPDTVERRLRDEPAV